MSSSVSELLNDDFQLSWTKDDSFMEDILQDVIGEEKGINPSTTIDCELPPLESSITKKSSVIPDQVDLETGRPKKKQRIIGKSSQRILKIYQCGVCGRGFKEQYTLKRHFPVHTDVREYVCSVCGRAFRQLSTLYQHRTIHSNVRAYSCEICSKKFRRPSTLNSHKKIHMLYKPYNCCFCKKSFHQKGNLRHHMFIHTNERPYQCEICQRGFNQQSNLAYHRNKVHNLAFIAQAIPLVDIDLLAEPIQNRRS